MKKVLASSAGFTIVELIVVTAATVLMVGILFQFGYEYTKGGLDAQLNLTTTADRYDASEVIRQYLSLASGLITQNSISDANAPSGTAWPALHPSDDDPSKVPTVANYQPVIYFKQPSYKQDGNIAVQATGIPYEDEYILYRNTVNKTLHLRSLANANVSNNKLKTSCPSTASSTSCPADKMVIGNVTAVHFQYYSKTGEVLDYYDSPDPLNPFMPGPDFDVVEVVQLKLDLQTKTNLDNQSRQVQTTIRVALRNG